MFVTTSDTRSLHHLPHAVDQHLRDARERSDSPLPDKPNVSQLCHGEY